MENLPLKKPTSIRFLKVALTASAGSTKSPSFETRSQYPTRSRPPWSQDWSQLGCLGSSPGVRLGRPPECPYLLYLHARKLLHRRVVSHGGCITDRQLGTDMSAA